MDEMNSIARDLDWIDRVKRAKNYLHPPRAKKNGFSARGIMIAFIAGLVISSAIFYWKEPITDWLTGVLGL